jgi:acetylglutamate kinase
VLLVHDTVADTPEVSFFVSKRVSSLLSEEMVTNTAVAGYQRGLVRLGHPHSIRQDLLAQLWQNVQVVVLSTTALGADGQNVTLKPEALLGLARHWLEPGQVFLLTHNPQTALVLQPQDITTPERANELLGLFPEEAEVLSLARTLRPVCLLAPNQLGA